jgi:hypothetical protein
MSSYFLRCYLALVLHQCLGFMVVLAHLGAVGYGFICNQWDRKGMNTDIYFSGSAIGDQGHTVIHSAVRIFSWLFWIVGSCLCLTSTQRFSPFLVRAIPCDRTGQALQTRESLSQPEWAEFAVCRTAPKCILHHRTDIRIGLWRAFNRRLRRFCPAREWYWQWHWWCYWHQLHTVDWQYTLLTYCTCSPQVYRRSERIKNKHSHPTPMKTPLRILTTRQGKQTPRAN